MKTTIDVRDDVLRRAKARAALRGEPLSRFIEISLERALREEEPDSSSWADWALGLPPVSSKSIVELNQALRGPDLRPIDPDPAQSLGSTTGWKNSRRSGDRPA